MKFFRRAASAHLRDLTLGLALVAPLVLVLGALPGHALAQPDGIRLFRVVTMREDVLLGLAPAELATLGEGSDVDRLARHIVSAGRLSAWRYVVGRAADGQTQLAARGRVAVLRQDALTIEAYTPALPVLPPPN